jgi:hypothetical protein
VSPVKYELGLYISEDDILHCHPCENLTSYTAHAVFCELYFSELFVLEDFLFISRFLEMVHWMDKVDINLQNIVKEVNTLEEFEKERTVFQVCLNASQIWCCGIA